MVIGNVRYRNEGAAELHDVLRVTFLEKDTLYLGWKN